MIRFNMSRYVIFILIDQSIISPHYLQKNNQLSCNYGYNNSNSQPTVNIILKLV